MEQKFAIFDRQLNSLREEVIGNIYKNPELLEE